MATITLRVEDGTRADLERLAQARETSVSELLRDAIADLLGTRRDLAGEETPRYLFDRPQPGAARSLGPV